MNKFELCNSCIKRHCNLVPKRIVGLATTKFTCTKYRKHQEGFTLEEVYHGKPEQRRD